MPLFLGLLEVIIHVLAHLHLATLNLIIAQNDCSITKFVPSGLVLIKSSACRHNPYSIKVLNEEPAGCVVKNI